MGAGILGKNVQNKRGVINDADFQQFLQVAFLVGSQ